MNALILSGGVAHEDPTTSARLIEQLDAAGFDCEVREDFALVEQGLPEVDLLVLNGVWWVIEPESEWHYASFELSEAARKGFLAHLRAGKGLFALHAATICFNDWPEWRRILGGWWEWGQSTHAPYGRFTARITEARHPLTEGLSDFEVTDELYTWPAFEEQPTPLLVGEWEGAEHPLLWAHDYGPARVVYNALGHGPETYDSPAACELARRCALWASRRLG